MLVAHRGLPHAFQFPPIPLDDSAWISGCRAAVRPRILGEATRSRPGAGGRGDGVTQVFPEARGAGA